MCVLVYVLVHVCLVYKCVLVCVLVSVYMRWCVVLVGACFGGCIITMPSKKGGGWM